MRSARVHQFLVVSVFVDWPHGANGTFDLALYTIHRVKHARLWTGQKNDANRERPVPAGTLKQSQVFLSFLDLIVASDCLIEVFPVSLSRICHEFSRYNNNLGRLSWPTCWVLTFDVCQTRGKSMGVVAFSCCVSKGICFWRLVHRSFRRSIFVRVCLFSFYCIFTPELNVFASFWLFFGDCIVVSHASWNFCESPLCRQSMVSVSAVDVGPRLSSFFL